MRLLVAVNPGASRAEAALDELATWFGENCEAVFITTHSQDDLKRILLHHGPAADRIVIGGGDGTISNALPELLQLDKPPPYCHSALPMTSPGAWGCPRTALQPPESR